MGRGGGGLLAGVGDDFVRREMGWVFGEDWRLGRLVWGGYRGWGLVEEMLVACYVGCGS